MVSVEDRMLLFRASLDTEITFSNIEVVAAPMCASGEPSEFGSGILGSTSSVTHIC